MMRTWKISLSYPDGTTVFIGTVRAEEVIEAPKAAPTSAQNGPTGDKMSEPQKRYLFRLLGAQKLEPKAIEAHLRDYFRVRALGEIPKQAASEYIDQLVKDQPEAASGNRA